MDLTGDESVDLTPREIDLATSVRRERRRGSRRWAWAVLALVVIAVGVVLVQGLGNATLFFRNVDEAVAEREDLGDRRFRIQGTVIGETIVRTDGAVSFTIEYNDVRAEIQHVGDPPDLFQPGIPVVLEGAWSQTEAHFDSTVMIVRHTNEYEADYGERLDEADQGGGG
ncbi:MAG: cytochrome c maturation protein CcmE [Actinomycetota bacterium]